MKILLFLIFYLLIFTQSIPAQDSIAIDSYIRALKQKGTSPAGFVLNALDTHDLIIFDDANHSAAEPFKFYGELIGNDKFTDKVQYIFIEAFPLNQQPYIDAYLNAETEDRTLLYPAFQNDYSGFGWRYDTYFDLLHKIYTVNKILPAEKRLKVAAVGSPVYWSEIKTQRDLELFRESLVSYDYTMYKIILESLDHFKSGRKGIFLTNTRHSYKGIKNSSGNYYWNCGTFFTQRNPGKTYSVRIHNSGLMLLKARNDPDAPKTTEGLETVEIKWSRIANGLWDDSFAGFGNIPVAIDIRDTPFGNDEYTGNHMLNALPGQTMYDAYDAVIFLAPLNRLHRSALIGEIYTPEFRLELERRLKIMYTPVQLQEKLKNNSVITVQEYIEKGFIYEPEKLLPEALSALK